MTTLQNRSQTDRYEDRDYREQQGSATAVQSEQSQQDDRPADREQSGDEGTFTVSMDDWFKS
jgi:hypothetical protein